MEYTPHHTGRLTSDFYPRPVIEIRQNNQPTGEELTDWFDAQVRCMELNNIEIQWVPVNELFA